ncbi:hypothetical protein CYMTET_2593 [Cymbomonas tetramitiformis]|uniref:Uncharacterized protein n=1 Tax=Cymbomonas tetramitiformis TaxID=36881 RepID=A0AAE0H4R0_9CHLO|nr:hypothetical protein CYMTET_2593 [Cymbomonas tetramitiformis]
MLRRWFFWIAVLLATQCFAREGVAGEPFQQPERNVIILEEASRLDEAVFTEVIVPLLNVRDTALLAISTPLDENNFYSTLLRMKEPNSDEPMFYVLEVTLICPACAERGVKDVCEHRRELLPPWKSDHRREEMTRMLFESQPQMYMQEQLGIPSGADACCYDRESLVRFATRVRYHVDTSTVNPIGQNVYMAIDTCGGGNNMMAIVSGYLTVQHDLVMGRDGMWGAGILRAFYGGSSLRFRKTAGPPSAGMKRVLFARNFVLFGRLIIRRLKHLAFFHKLAYIRAQLRRPVLHLVAETFSAQVLVDHIVAGVDQQKPGVPFCHKIARVLRRVQHLDNVAVISMDATAVTSDNQLTHELSSHAQRLRDRMHATACIISIIEANYGGWVQASRVAQILQPYQPVRHLSADSSKLRRPGVLTSAESKERMRHELQRYLAENRVHMELREQGGTRVDDVQLLLKQLRQFEYVYKPGASRKHTECKRVITGKLHGRNDDLAIAMMLLAYWPLYHALNGDRVLT